MNIDGGIYDFGGLFLKQSNNSCVIWIVLLSYILIYRVWVLVFAVWYILDFVIISALDVGRVNAVMIQLLDFSGWHITLLLTLSLSSPDQQVIQVLWWLMLGNCTDGRLDYYLIEMTYPRLYSNCTTSTVIA